ncbi:MAG TPA: hypothetical protein VLA04_03695 [Verrucomicrobiae bacterium]|nr:hypothetical protein [Verrucomicrobiae bacterium]
MAEEQTFYDQPVDQTPYGAFVWVVTLALVFTGVSGYGLWKLGSWVKSKRFLQETRNVGATDALLNKVKQEGASAVDQAKAAAEDAANASANEAKSRATQELLQQKDAAIKTGTDAAKEEIKTQANQTFQQYLSQ